jgi:hypothetical protein
MREESVKKVIASLKCSTCGQSYREAGIDVLEHKEEVWFLKVLCPACHAGSLVAAIIREEAPLAVTDLTGAELERFRDVRAVTGDDLLEMHAFLKYFDGNVAGLFG